MAALAQLLPQTDVFHFYFGLTLVPKSLQFPILRAARKKSIYHFLGSDIRGKTPSELAYGSAPTREIVGSYDASAGCPTRERRAAGPRPAPVHAGAAVRPRAAARRPRAVEPRAKGTAHVIAACAQLPVELEIVEGLHHAEARERYRRADIVVDQLNAGWHGIFALEAMALGKPVVTYLKPDVVEQAEGRTACPCRSSRRRRRRSSSALRPLVESPALRARSAPRAAPTSSASTTSTGSPTA